MFADATLSTLFTRHGPFVVVDSGDPDSAAVIMQGGFCGLFEMPLLHDSTEPMKYSHLTQRFASLNAAFYALGTVLLLQLVSLTYCLELMWFYRP